jgi:hypothetical protein
VLLPWLPIEPCVFVSVPVAFVELVPPDAVAVPCAFCVPAVELVPETEPDWFVPLDVSFPAVRVLLLLLLQPKTSAAASANPYAYFMRFLLEGICRGVPVGAAALRAGKSPAASEK